MVDYVYCLTSLLLFDVLLLYYYINLRLSITFCFSSGDIYRSSGISLSFSFVIVSGLFCCELFETFVILLATFLPIKSPVASVAFWIAHFESVFSSVADFF